VEKVYKILENIRRENLEAKVNELLASKEWVVTGGVSMCKTANSFMVYTQALVKVR